MLLLVMQINAMEIVTQDQSSLINDICYLNKMPQNVKNHIASFLGWETKEAFVERTRRTPSRCGYKALCYRWVVSPDKKKKAILDCNMDSEYCSQLNVYNIPHKQDVSITLNMPFSGAYIFTAFDFNTQGTHLLVRCLYSHHEGEPRRRKRIFFPLSAIIFYEKGFNKKEEDILEEYFKHHFVCKKLNL